MHFRITEVVIATAISGYSTYHYAIHPHKTLGRGTSAPEAFVFGVLAILSIVYREKLAWFWINHISEVDEKISKVAVASLTWIWLTVILVSSMHAFDART